MATKDGRVMKAMMAGLEHARKVMAAEGVKVDSKEDLIAAMLAAAEIMSGVLGVDHREMLVCALAATGATEAEAHALVAETWQHQIAN